MASAEHVAEHTVHDKDICSLTARLSSDPHLQRMVYHTGCLATRFDDQFHILHLSTGMYWAVRNSNYD